MTGARVKSAPDAVELLLGTPAAAALVAEGAAAVAGYAAEAVPVHTGAAADSYQSTAATLDEHGLTATAFTDDFAGALIEFGSINNPAYRPLTQGVERAGLHGTPYPKGQG